MNKNIINNRQSLEDCKVFLDRQFEKHKYLSISIKIGRQRTLTQNASLHLFCQLLADALNDGGFDFRVFIKEGYPVPFNKNLVKDYLWRPIQKAITGKSSTAKPETHEYSVIYDALNVKLADHDIHVPWPCKDLINE